MLEVARVTVHPVATELGIGAGVLRRWRRKLHQETLRTFLGQGQPREEEVVQLNRELTRVTKERNYSRATTAFFARTSR